MKTPTDSAPPVSKPWRELLTETRHAASRELDRMPCEEIVRLILEEDRRGLDAALTQRQAVARAADWVAEALAGSGDVILAGAGTSGRLAILEAAECPPTFGTDPKRIRAVMAGGPEAVFQALEGAEDSEVDGQGAVAGLGPEDVLLGISASSVTPFVQGALAQARKQGAKTILLTCAAPGGLEEVADLLIALATGPEILTGSTRLKAGSATKAVLNAVTTAAMVRLGKVFENLMVDLRPGSAKLRDRALRIIEAATGISAEVARSLHEEADGEVKTAILMASGSPLEVAREALAAAGGHVGRALERVAEDRS